MSGGSWPSWGCGIGCRRSYWPSKPAWSDRTDIDGPSYTPAVPSADTDFGVFTDDGPWVLDLDHVAWKPGLGRVRAQLRASLPRLIRHRIAPPGARVGTT